MLAFILFGAVFIHIAYLYKIEITPNVRHPLEIFLQDSNPFLRFLEVLGGSSNSYMPLIWPLFMMLLNGDSLFLDYKTGFYQFALSRTTHRRYIQGKIVAVAVTTFGFLMAFQMIAFLYCLVTCPYVLPTSVSVERYMGYIFLTPLYLTHPYAYVFLVMILMSVMSATMSMLGIIASTVLKNIVMVVGLPWMVYLVLGQLMMIPPGSSYIYKYSPISLTGIFIFESNYSVMEVLVYWLIWFVLLALAAYKLSIRKFKVGF